MKYEIQSMQEIKSTSSEFRNSNFKTCNFGSFIFYFFTPVLFFLSSCNIYKFNEAAIPPEVKTIKIALFENRARYVNPQLAPSLTDRFQSKVVSQTRLTRTNDDDAHYQVSGYISDYTVTTSAISQQQAATQRLTVGVHITFKNTLDNKTEEIDLSRSFDFSANRSLQEAEAALREDIVRNLTDEIFNRIFSKW